MDPQQSPDRRLDELREENKALKNQNAEFRVQLNKLKKANSKIAKELNKTMKELRDVKERLVLSEEVTVATQRRELQQKGIYENLLAGNDYEKLRPELREEHEYTKLQPGALEVLRKQYKDLATRLDAQILAAHLYQRNAITVMDLQEIQSLSELPAKAAEKLLNIILVQPAAVYLYFLDALKDTNQRHVYESLVENSLKDDKQLSRASVIQEQYVFLREALDVKFSGLVGELYSKKVLSPDEKDDISAERTSCRANEKLLSVLSRKSPQQFQLFLDALDNCGQEHVRSVIDDRQVSPKLSPVATQQASASSPVTSVPPQSPQKQRSRTVESVKQEYLQSSPRVIYTFRDVHEVCGVTLLNKELYVLRQRAVNHIEVYSTTDFNILRCLPLRARGKNMTDMTSCVQKQCVYIADHGNSCVHRVTVDGSETMWPVSSCPESLSVKRSSNLLVTCVVTAGRLNSCVIELSSYDGQCLREIALETNLPWHAVQLDNGQLVVCHGRGDCSQVSHVAGDGTIVRSTKKDADLSLPYRVVVDNDNFLFVADTNTRRVLLFDPSLSFVCSMLERIQDRCQPCRLCYDDVTRRLYVAQNDRTIIVVRL